MGEIIFLVVIIFLSGLTNSTFGFGFSLVAMSLLTLHFKLAFITPLVPLLFLSTNLLIVIRARKVIKWKAITFLMIGATLAIPMGVWLNKNGDEKLIKTIIGLFLIGFGIFNLYAPKLPVLKNSKTAPFFGFLSGLFGGAYNITGPPIVIYGLFRNWNPQVFRATLQGYFTYTTLLIIAFHVYNDNLQDPRLFQYYLIALPLVLVSAPMGKKINASFKDPEKFKQYIYYLMLILGAVMLLKAYQFI